MGATGTALATEGTRYRPPVESAGGIVVTESPAASRVGRQVLSEGGNAVDAAVSTVFAMGVARPQSCGIGGGGFMVYRSAGGRTAALDFRETAPAAVTSTTFAGPGPHRTFTGHRTVGVPGTVAGMDAALERFGTRTLSEAVAPAERLARVGFRVPVSMSAAMAQNADRLKLFPAAARQFLVNGTTPYAAGETLRQPDLAATLRRIGTRGADGFYSGPVAERIVASMATAEQQLAGDVGLLTSADLAGYRAKFRPPLVGSYRDATLVAMPPPTSGGVATLQMLNLLEGFDLKAAGQSSADALHLIAESQKIAFADRAVYVADPDAVEVPDVLASKEYAVRRRAEIDLARAKTYRPGLAGAARAAGADTNPAASTTHISVVDAAGNAVALTCTVEQEFGSAVVAPGTGVLLNNELTDFSDPGTANEPRAGKRPRSSMNPTIVVQDGRPTAVVGGAGGVRIIMGTLLAMINVIDFDQNVGQAIDAERIDANGAAGRLIVEAPRVSASVQAELTRRGHVFAPTGEYDLRPRVQIAGIDLATGRRVGQSDPRTDFAALRAPRPAAERGTVRRDVSDPTVSLRLRATRSARRAVIVVDFRGRDRGSGVAEYVTQFRAPGARVFTDTTAFPQRGGALQRGIYGPARRGTYRIRVRAIDRAGNVSDYDEASIRVGRR